MENIKGLKYFMHLKYMYDKKFALKLFDLVIWFNFFDAITTYIGIKFFPSIIEKNTFVLNQINTYGLAGTMIVKVIIGIALMVLLKEYFPFQKNKKWDKIFIFCIYIPVVTLLIYTVVMNMIVILNHSQIYP